MKPKSSVQEFAETIKNNPKEIIAWAKREIKCYNELILIVQKKYAKRTKNKRHNKTETERCEN